LGAYDTEIPFDEVFQYDGQTLKLSKGLEFALPQLKSTYGEWFVEETSATRKSAPAPVESKPKPFPVLPVEEESSVVTSVVEQQRLVKAAERGQHDDVAKIRSMRSARKDLINQGLPSLDDFGDLDLKSLTVEEADKINAEILRRSVQYLDKVAPSSKTTVGGTLQSTMDTQVMVGGKFPLLVETGATSTKKYAFKTAHLSGSNLIEEGKAQAFQSESVSLDAITNNLAPPRPLDDDPAPRRATRPTPPPQKSEEDEISDIVSGWSTKRNWQKRVEEAVTYYGDWPEALEAICQIESEAVVKKIQAALSK
jgi:hypothetical protein